MSVCAIREACRALVPSRYAKAMDFFLEVRASFRKDGATELEVLQKFVRPRVLVVDALEEPAETPFEDRLLAHLLDRRYDDCKDTILISNQTPEDFDRAVGPSVVSRLNETGGKIVCNWGSFRETR
jgi:DNA replication protein DnaC